MMSYVTKYGDLGNIPVYDTYSDGRLKDCILNKKVALKTPHGILIPQYEQNGVRKKYTNSVTFFKNGNIKKIALNSQVVVDTLVGKIPAELITFYKSGNIKRIFPLNGKISGYWSEEDEYGLAKELVLDLPFGKSRMKIISIYFYENGLIRSVTMWPKERNIINTPLGSQKTRIGMAFYSNGRLKSYEPASQVNIDTPIGKIVPYNVNAVGITGDDNSVKFYEDGKLKSLVASGKQVKVIFNNKEFIYSPKYINDISDSDLFFKPLKIEFENDMVIFNELNRYVIGKCRFEISDYYAFDDNVCMDCSSCGGCS